MSKRGGKRGCVCLIPNLSGKALNFSPFSMMLAVGFSLIVFIKCFLICQGIIFCLCIYPACCSLEFPESVILCLTLLSE